MNLSGNTIRVCSMAAILLLFAGCNKLYDYIKHHPGGIEDDCRIKTITHRYYGSTRTLTFEYNKLGNPVHISNDDWGTGNPNHRFVYDKKNRLILYNGYYGDTTNFEYRINYYYDKQDRVTHDSSWFLGYYNPDGSIFSFSQYVTTYKYDQYGRISRTIQRDLLYHYPPDTTLYNYDGKGNLIDQFAEYDNQTSFLRTHPLWMFLNRNYSVNNNFKAAGYNKKGLPLKTSYPHTRYFDFLWFVIPDADFTWECK